VIRNSHSSAKGLPRLLIIGLGALVVSCNRVNGPSIGPPPTNVFTIEPSLGGIKVNSVVTLTAVLNSVGGSRHNVLALWSSDAPDILAVDEGRVRGVKVGRATVRAAFEGMSALQSLQVVPDFEGEWHGTYHISTCTRLSGGGPDTCRFELANGGAVFPLSAVLTQSGVDVRGTAQFYADAKSLIESGSVEGTIDDAGSLTLRGTTLSVHPEHPSETSLTEWRTAFSDSPDHMIGQFTRIQKFNNFWGPQQVTELCDIVLLTQSPH
jgi:hypothetical protein